MQDASLFCFTGSVVTGIDSEEGHENRLNIIRAEAVLALAVHEELQVDIPQVEGRLRLITPVDVLVRNRDHPCAIAALQKINIFSIGSA